MITLTLLILTLNISAVLGYFLYQQHRKLQAYVNFKPFHFTIGQVEEYNATHEKFLMHNKEVMRAFRRYISVNLATIPDQMATP